MSSVTSLAGYNGTGTQGTAVTDKLDDTVRSVFWNENNTNRALIYGSQLVEVPGGGDDKIGGSKTWVLDNTPDVIGDLFLRIRVPAPTTPSSTNVLMAQCGLLNVIDRIDIKVGSQTWQTLDRNTIYALLCTELENGQFNGIVKSLSGGETVPSNSILPTSISSVSEPCFFLDERNQGYSYVAEDDKHFSLDVFFPLLAFTKNYIGVKTSFNSINESGHFYCAAPDQQFTVQIYFSNGNSNSTSALSPLPTCNSVFTKQNTTELQTNLYYRQITMSNIERSSIINAPAGIPKRIKLTQEIPNIDLNSSRTRIDCSRFNLYASHLILTVPLLNQDFLARHLFGMESMFNFELHINGTSLFGVMPSIAFNNGSSNYYLGINNNKVGLLLDASNSITAASSRISDACAQVRYTYIIPLASTAYGGSSLPLNRFDSITLTVTPVTGSTQGVFATNGASLTCVGESVALYKEGAASLATY